MLDRPVDAAAAPASGGRARRTGERAARPWAGITGDQAQTGAMNLAAVLSILRRRRLTLIVCSVLVPLIAALALARITPRYTATGAVMYEPSSYALQELQSILHVDPTTDAVTASQAEIIRSMRVAFRVAEHFDLARRPEFNRALRPAPLWAPATAAFRRWFPALFRPEIPLTEADIAQRVAQAVQDRLLVQTIRASRVMEVSFTSEDRVLAAAAANLAMDLYISDQLDAKFQAVGHANTWLSARVTELRRDVQQREDAIAAYRAQAGLLQGVQAGLDTEQLSRLSTDLLQARNDLAQASARLDAVRGRPGAAGERSGAGAGMTAQAAIAPSVVTLRAQEATLSAQLRSLQTRLGGSHPDTVALRDQLGDVQRAVAAETGRVVAAAEAEVRADAAKVATLEQSLREAQAQGGRDSQAQIPLNAMQREADASRTLLQVVLERLQQTAQQTAIEKPDARVISAALTPVAQSFPKVGLLLAAACAFGVLFGLAVVYLLEISDSTFRSGDDVRGLLGLPCFALVPQIPRRALGRMAVHEYVAHKPLSPFSEQMRALRTGLWLGAKRPKVIAITAARPAEGKTTVAIALARSAAISGERVLAIDCDVRQPAFGHLMRADGTLGIIDCLLGHAELKDAIRRDPLTGMDFIPAGAGAANSLGLFMSDAMTALIERLRGMYDLVLLDAPPAFAMADARVVAQLADATLLCVRWRDTPRSVVRNSLDLLHDADATVIGVALTRVDARVHVRSGFPDAEIYHPRYGGYFRE